MTDPRQRGTKAHERGNALCNSRPRESYNVTLQTPPREVYPSPVVLSTAPPTIVAILVVAHEPTDTAVLDAVIEPLGATCVKAASPGEAEEIAAESEISAMVVRLDDAVQEMVATAQAVRSRINDPTLPVLFVSDSPPSEETLRRVADLGWAECVPVESNPDEARSRLSMLVDLHQRSMLAMRRQLEEHESKLTAAFEMAHEGIWLLDADGRVTSLNHRMSEIIGYAVPAVVRHACSEFIFPEDRGEFGRQFEQMRGGRGVASAEIRLRHRDGHGVVALHSSRPMFRDGAFAGAIEMFTDVTEARIAEERFKLFFTLSSAGHALVDPATMRFIDVNQKFADMVGRTPEELRQLTFLDVTHPDDRRQDIRLYSRFLSGEASEVSAEKRYITPDGTVTWVHLTTTVVRDKEGRPEIQLTVVQDITARKRAEADLEENRTRLRLAIEAAELGIFYHNGCTAENSWNERARQLHGLGPEVEASPTSLLQRVHPEDRPRVAAEIRRLLDSRAARRDFAIEYRVVWPDGSIHFLATNGTSQVRPAPAGTLSPHIIGTVRDVTAVRQSEMELQRMVNARTSELQEKTNQLESFCYTVAHDLRAPLRAINGYADIISEELEVTGIHANVRDYLDRIRHSTRKLDTLIRDLMTYSRMTDIALRPEPVDLMAAVRAALRELEPELKRVAARVSVPAQLPAVLAERSILEQVLVNLLSNATKFTAPGTAPVVEILAETKQGVVRLSIRDNGIGIPSEYHDRIFRMFERLEAARDYPGTGIGLAIVARAMQRMGGRVGLESVPGQGSTFWIQLTQAPS